MTCQKKKYAKDMNNWFTEKEIKIAVSNKKMLLTGNKKKIKLKLH